MINLGTEGYRASFCWYKDTNYSFFNRKNGRLYAHIGAAEKYKKLDRLPYSSCKIVIILWNTLKARVT